MGDLPSWLRSKGTCPVCGKARYETRRAARQVGRAQFPERQVRAYRCGNVWHFTTTQSDKVAAAWRSQ